MTLYPSFSILLVDDEPAWLRTLGLTLERSAGITNIIRCHDGRHVREILQEGNVGIVILDLTMPHVSGEEILRDISESHPEVTVIVVSGMSRLETAVACMRLGAFDYFVKTVEEDRLVSGVRRAIQMQELQRENREISDRFLTPEIRRPEVFSPIVTADPAMTKIFTYVEAVAGSKQPLLITGESGVGKELIARAAHRLSGCSGQLVAINVAGLDDNVFSDTLFGHVRGAFTGAEQPRRGMVEEAAEGTLFLDEIGDLSIPSQVKLLRLLQEGEYFPLGSDRPKRVRARIIVATHHRLGEREAEGRFRRDLYYRLRTHHLHIPPLRDRKGDIPLLLDHFLEQASLSLGKKKPTPPRELAGLLATYSFPGNIRELRSMVHDAVALHRSGVLSMESFVRAIGTPSLPVPVSQQTETNPFTSLERLPTFPEAIDLLVDEAMQRSNGNQTLAARLLGVTQPALSKRLKGRNR